jgi:hypothetical protein
MAEKPQDPDEPKRKRSQVPALIKKAGQLNARLDHAYQREDGKSDERLIKLRSILNDAIPGLERQLRISKIVDAPGVRDFLISMKFRV